MNIEPPRKTNASRKGFGEKILEILRFNILLFAAQVR
jgi:hypothetical protein